VIKSEILSDYFRKGYESYSNHGARVFFARLVNFTIAKIRMTFLRGRLDTTRWGLIKDSKKGETLFIIGNGPSLNVTPMYLLKDQDTFCFNGFHLMLERLSWCPTYYMVTDDLVAHDLKNDIPKTLIHVEKAFFPLIHPSNKGFYKFIEPSEKIYWLDATHPGFSRKLPKCGINNTVANAAIQIGAFMGYSRIAFLGVDLSYADMAVDKTSKRNWVSKEEDPNHFDSRYFGSGKRFHDPQPDKMLERFVAGREFFSDDVEFINCGVGGQLNAFSRKSIMDVLDLDRPAHLDLFLTEISGRASAKQISTFRESDSAELLLDGGARLVRELDTGMVKELLKLNHVKGPFNDIFYLEPRV
jgi:hypothetical protein